MSGLSYFSTMRNLLLLTLNVLIFTACNNTTKHLPKELKLEGATMGTTYHVTYIDSLGVDHQKAIDSVLVEVNQQMSTYIPASEISKFNQLTDTATWTYTVGGFMKTLDLAAQIHDKTQGAFDPTVMPLVNAYGFGYEKMAQIDSALIDSLMAFVGFEKLELLYVIDPKDLKEELGIKKHDVRTKLDLSAIAKGYGVDVVGALLESYGIGNYMVEIGGEVLTKGHNIQDKPWSIGIDKPSRSNQFDHQLQAIVKLNNKAMATSGNYRNYKDQNGVKFVHTIDPKSGWPKISNTLSVSVIADDCATADGYATAFMVMGVDKGLELAESLNELEAYFIYVDSNNTMKTAATTGFAKIVEELK